MNYKKLAQIFGCITAGLYVLAPVSYTHLDVYKRQGWRRSRNNDGGW